MNNGEIKIRFADKKLVMYILVDRRPSLSETGRSDLYVVVEQVL